MGSLQLEPATILIKHPPTMSPSSHLHEGDFEEDNYLGGDGVRGFNMSNVNVDKRVDKEKVSSYVGYGDERKLESRSSRCTGCVDGCLGNHLQVESKATILGEQREKKIWWVSGGGGEERKRGRVEGSKEVAATAAWEEVSKAKEEEKGGGGGGGGGEVDYVHRGQWLRAAILGANDGLVSTASLMMGVGAVKEDDAKAMIVSGLAGLVGGACSMAIGEFVSVYSQRDAETFDKKSRKQKQKLADTHFQDLEEAKSPLDNFFFGQQHHPFKRGSHEMICIKDNAFHSGAYACTQQLDLHGARDKTKMQGGEKQNEDTISTGPNPWEAAGASGLAFALGAMVPLLSASFIRNHVLRLGVLVGVSSGALLCMGSVAAMLSAGNVTKGGVRVLLGGWAAMLVTYGLLRLFGTSGM